MSQLHWLKESSRSLEIGAQLQKLAGHRSTKANEEIQIAPQVLRLGLRRKGAAGATRIASIAVL